MAGGAVAPGGSGGNPLRTGFITRPFLWAFILVTSLFFLWGFAYGLLGELHLLFVRDVTDSLLQMSSTPISKRRSASPSCSLPVFKSRIVSFLLSISASSILSPSPVGVGYFLFSPVAAECLKRFGYKKTIIMGLSLYSLGAVLFWPVAKASLTSTNKGGIFGGFVVCTAVVACGGLLLLSLLAARGYDEN